MGDVAVRQGGDGARGKARGDWVSDRFRPHRRTAAIEKRTEPSLAPRIVVRRAILMHLVSCHRNSEGASYRARDAANGVAGKAVFEMLNAKAAIYAKFFYRGC